MQDLDVTQETIAQLIPQKGTQNKLQQSAEEM